jgi:tetratricopeptide (TPR) repeat protein
MRASSEVVMDRVAMLEEFIAKSPDDPFPRYGLALEHKNAGRLDKAAEVFAELMTRCPDYVAAYLHAGNTLVALGKKADAADVYRRGIAAARKKGDGHALGELEGALAQLDD